MLPKVSTNGTEKQKNICQNKTSESKSSTVNIGRQQRDVGVGVLMSPSGNVMVLTVDESTVSVSHA